ncbi:hypothetical protein KY285_016468 [Solanum tuberosum]|nr:hypothetical protein KY285_016468 [Solanum tuberosum]
MLLVLTLCFYTCVGSEPDSILRTRASVSSGRDDADPEAVIETPARGRGRDRARSHAHVVAPSRGHARCAAPTRGRAREVSLEPQVEDQVPLEFEAYLF